MSPATTTVLRPSRTDAQALKRVLLVIPPLTNPASDGAMDTTRPDFETRRLVSPVEPANVAGDLLRRGLEVEIFDLGVFTDGRRYDHLADKLARYKADAVVVVQSILTFVTAMDWECDRIFNLARAANPGVVTVLTGNHATNYPGKAVGEGVCDYSIRGEVDLAVGKLLEILAGGGDLSGVPGVAYRGQDGKPVVVDKYPEVDLADIAMPAYGILDATHVEGYATVLEKGKIRYPEKSPHYRDIMGSRSCILRCAFCSVSHLRGPRQKYRRKAPERIIAEIEQALEQGIKEIHFFDDLFAHNEADVFTFTNEIARRNLKFDWFIGQGMPLWVMNWDTLSAMRDTGMYRVIAPFETGSNRVLKEVVGKIHSTVEHHSNVAKWVQKLGMELMGLFVIGLPGETREDILTTLEFAEAHPEIDYSVFSIATPLVGTRLMRAAARDHGFTEHDQINRVIKRTVGLFRTGQFNQYELGVIRSYDWIRINFSTEQRRRKYAGMVGMTMDELDAAIQDSINVFTRFFPDYDGPKSFRELYNRPDLYTALEPIIPKQLYS